MSFEFESFRNSDAIVQREDDTDGIERVESITKVLQKSLKKTNEFGECFRSSLDAVAGCD